MAVRKQEVKLPHLGIEHELCAYGHGDLNDPLRQLLAAEERGELNYPRQAVATVATRHPVSTLLLRRG